MEYAWLEEEPQISSSQIAQTYETDVLICGAGMGGLFAAATAAEFGLNVLLIEKQGHFAKMKEEVAAIDSKLQLEAGTHVDRFELLKEASQYTSNYIDQRLWRLWMEESAEAINWWADVVAGAGSELVHQQGVDTHPDPLHTFAKFETGHRTRFDGMEGSRVLWEYAETRGAKLMMKTPLVKLLREEGRVCGAIARNVETEEFIRINARYGVIVATGGYARNDEMLRALQPETLDMMCMNIYEGSGMGDGIKACLWAGAHFDDRHCSMLFDRGILRPDETPTTRAQDGRSLELNAQPFLKVNLNGERFSNESIPYDYILHAAHLQPGGTYCVIFDGKYEDDVAKFDMAGCSRLTKFPNGAPTRHSMPEMVKKLARYVDEGRYVKADTLEELAEGLGIPADALVATVARYNELCEQGEDVDFGKNSEQLTTVVQPPFYGCRAAGMLLCTLDGIRIDTSMRALDDNCEPIPGLYPVGNDSGGYFANGYFNFVTGCAGGRTVTFARLAVKNIAREAGLLK